MVTKVTALFVIAFLSSPVQARDIYVLRFHAAGAMTSACSQITWSDEVLVQNSATEPAAVELVDTTYELPLGTTRQLLVLAGKMTSLESAAPQWQVSEPPFVGVAHLRVPEGVHVASRTLPGIVNCTGACLCPLFTVQQGAVAQQVFTDLIPAKSPHIHLGADLPGLSTRVNVHVYNAGNDPADVAIEMRQSCGDILLSSVHFVVPPRSVTAAGLVPELQTCPVSESTPDRSTYVRLVSSEPGLSWVTALANDIAVPRANIAAN